MLRALVPAIWLFIQKELINSLRVSKAKAKYIHLNLESARAYTHLVVVLLNLVNNARGTPARLIKKRVLPPPGTSGKPCKKASGSCKQA